jgi:hypothetical protein
MDEGLVRSRALDIRIARLPHRLRIAFAAGCAERALPVLEYEDYPGGPGFLSAFRAAVEAVWAAALDPTIAPDQLDTTRQAVEVVFPEGDYYSGYQNTMRAGVGVLRALDAVEDSSGRAVADVSLHVSSAYEGMTECDAEPTDDLGWQELAVGRLERWGEQPVTRAIFEGLPPPPSDKFGVL